MVLRRAIGGLATHRPRPYLVEAPGGAVVRAALETELDRRGWVAAESAASADALLVAGALPEGLEPTADLLWSQLPGPRARVTVRRAGDAPDALEAIRADLRDTARQRADAAARPADEVSPWLPGEDEGDEHQHHDGSHDHGGHDHGSMAPGGIPLAEGGEDRDGLEMDVLAHPLGPLLDHWPGGLELRVVLHGDVVGDLEARWWSPADATDGGTGGGTGGGIQDATVTATSSAYDAVATTLTLTGDAVGARLARRLRDAPPGVGDATGTARLVRRVTRWRRWSVLPADAATALVRLLTETTGDRGEVRREPLDDAGLAGLLVGRDLADARLLVAAHAPRLLGAPAAGVHHG